MPLKEAKEGIFLVDKVTYRTIDKKTSERLIKAFTKGLPIVRAWSNGFLMKGYITSLVHHEDTGAITVMYSQTGGPIAGGFIELK